MEETLPKILIVDDTEINIDILLNLLSENYDVLVAVDGESALEIAYTENIELILLDVMMPYMDGYEMCKILKANPKTKEVPVIFLTAKVDENSIEKAFDVGGSDYVAKPFKPKELLARVRTQLKLRCLIGHLEYISSYDTMTGIFNRRKFFELSEYKFGNEKENLYAIMIDIDKFKDINDNHGHSLGDTVIKLVASTIKELLLEGSVFGRLGGEEFGVIQHYSSKEVALQNVELMREAIERLEVKAIKNQVVKFTISSGIAKYNKDITTLDNFLKEADFSLYEAKGKGRNKSIFRE